MQKSQANSPVREAASGQVNQIGILTRGIKKIGQIPPPTQMRALARQ